MQGSRLFISDPKVEPVYLTIHNFCETFEDAKRQRRRKRIWCWTDQDKQRRLEQSRKLHQVNHDDLGDDPLLRLRLLSREHEPGDAIRGGTV